MKHINKLILFLVLAFALFIPPNSHGFYYAAEEQRPDFEESKAIRHFGDYVVMISSSEDETDETLSIVKNGHVVFEETESGSHYYFGNFTDGTDLDPYSGTDINGNSVPDLVISKWTGGAHCCNLLYIFEVGERFRHIGTVEGGSYDFKLIDLDEDHIPEIEFSDGAIDYQFASFAYSPPGRVVLKFTGDNYEVADQIMKKPMPSLKSLAEAKTLIRQEFKRGESPDVPYALLKIMMDLSYSGYLDAALVMADQTWPFQKPGLVKFKSDFKQALAESLYWPEFNRR